MGVTKSGTRLSNWTHILHSPCILRATLCPFLLPAQKWYGKPGFLYARMRAFPTGFSKSNKFIQRQNLALGGCSGPSVCSKVPLWPADYLVLMTGCKRLTTRPSLRNIRHCTSHSHGKKDNHVKRTAVWNSNIFFLELVIWRLRKHIKRNPYNWLRFLEIY